MKIAILTCQNWPGALEQERQFANEFPAQYEVSVEIWKIGGILP